MDFQVSKYFVVQEKEKTKVIYIYEFRHNSVLSLNQIAWRRNISGSKKIWIFMEFFVLNSFCNE
ncbi:hypothetical protein LEP1GSC081_1097 [Leptospira kirschneri str. H1]|uniref:Uncharacterized protein n=2 Tax=Leptospira kirschneri str. H1 TaxID=1049966 RepID=A0A0E2B8J4_9LEPT|nr:hypothetical protein LEP1GSC081_1097 [Leptospira kirschneri str. H1]